MNLLPAIDIRGYARSTPARLKSDFLVDGLFVRGRATFNYWETDRAVLGGVVPTTRPIELGCPKELAATYFNERRETGVINIAGPGAVEVDGQRYELARYDCLYIGRGAQKVVFHSTEKGKPAHFYVLSYPAHTSYPTQQVKHADALGVSLGSDTDKNSRVLYKYIHPAGVKSCQLVMGLTMIQAGSKWNTMPPHTHLRRSEVYLYFDLPPTGFVKHYVGQPAGIRHLRLRNRQAVLSPPWSIHCGAGSVHYSFIWGMGGENQEFADMDPVDPALIR